VVVVRGVCIRGCIDLFVNSLTLHRTLVHYLCEKQVLATTGKSTGVACASHIPQAHANASPHTHYLSTLPCCQPVAQGRRSGLLDLREVPVDEVVADDAAPGSATTKQ